MHAQTARFAFDLNSLLKWQLLLTLEYVLRRFPKVAAAHLYQGIKPPNHFGSKVSSIPMEQFVATNYA